MNATGFYFACQGTWIIAVILDAACFEGDANVGSWEAGRTQKTRKKNVDSSQFHLNFTPSRCGITLKDSRSNIGSLAESLQMSHVCRSYYRSSIWHTHRHTHTQAHRQQDSKWQSFPVDTCHPIYGCLKKYHSITALFYHGERQNKCNH